MFQKVPEANYAALKTILEARLPKSAMLYNLLTIVQTDRQPPIFSTTFYAFHGQLEVGGGSGENEACLIALQISTASSSVILSTPIAPTEEMVTALEGMVNWDLPICFAAVDILYFKLFENLAKKHGTVNLGPCDFMTMTIERTKTLEIRPNDKSVEVKELSPSDAVLVVNRWKYASPKSEEQVPEMIRRIGSAGVFLDSRLVSMVVIFAMGSINALYTEDDCRGKGYGKLTMQKVCQVAGERGLVPNVQIELGNTPSKTLMESTGFAYSHNIVWVFYEPSRQL